MKTQMRKIASTALFFGAITLLGVALVGIFISSRIDPETPPRSQE